jgi:hypothetical protein
MLGRVLGIDATVHGFRSAMRDWMGDRTSVERDVAEACLAHAVGGVEGAYMRGSALEKRRAALALWERHVLGAGDDATTVVPFVRR